MAHFFDPQTQKVTANVLVDARPRVVVFSPDEKHVWVAAEVGGTVAIINAATEGGGEEDPFSVPGVRKEFIQPEGIRFAKDGHDGLRRLGPRQSCRGHRHEDLRGQRAISRWGAGCGSSA